MNEASRESSEHIVQLLTNAQQQLTRYVRTLVPNRSDAEEVLQETNLFVWRHADEFEVGTNFAAWVCKIAYYQVLTFRKRQSRSR
jgi:RNA polymerase sigma-70 factor (ECF subfamily)